MTDDLPAFKRATDIPPDLPRDAAGVCDFCGSVASRRRPIYVSEVSTSWACLYCYPTQKKINDKRKPE